MIKDIVVNLPLRAIRIEQPLLQRRSPAISVLMSLASRSCIGPSLSVFKWARPKNDSSRNRTLQPNKLPTQPSTDWHSRFVAKACPGTPIKYQFLWMKRPAASPKSPTHLILRSSRRQSRTGGIDDLITQAVLFQSGHPILVVPYIQTASFRLEPRRSAVGRRCPGDARHYRRHAISTSGKDDRSHINHG